MRNRIVPPTVLSEEGIGIFMSQIGSVEDCLLSAMCFLGMFLRCQYSPAAAKFNLQDHSETKAMFSNSVVTFPFVADR